MSRRSARIMSSRLTIKSTAERHSAALLWLIRITGQSYSSPTEPSVTTPLLCRSASTRVVKTRSSHQWLANTPSTSTILKSLVWSSCLGSYRKRSLTYKFLQVGSSILRSRKATKLWHGTKCINTQFIRDTRTRSCNSS